jgi:hypothetical protein
LRIRHIAYLGLFGINMPLLYEEGEKAFARLLEEIIRTSDDDSILCWDYPYPGVGSGWYSTLFPTRDLLSPSLDQYYLHRNVTTRKVTAKPILDHEHRIT